MTKGQHEDFAPRSKSCAVKVYKQYGKRAKTSLTHLGRIKISQEEEHTK